MKWLCPTTLLVIIAFKLLCMGCIEIDSMSGTTLGVSDNTNSHRMKLNRDGSGKTHTYSKWGRWSVCEMGRKTRRRHCLRHAICGETLRIEVARCKDANGTTEQEDYMKKLKIFKNGTEMLQVQTADRRQLDSDDIQKRFRGFSPWTKWSNCSRRCITIRKRYCLVPAFCGNKLLRQSAYCYLEGSYCHQWIRARMQRRKDPGANQYTVKETMAEPVPGFHKEDSRVSRAPQEGECGRMGRYRGPPANRLRSRMRDMIRIIGGRPSPPGKWPWQVAVLNRWKEAFCGGTLVSLRWVVTAAHCVRRRLFVRLGEHDLFIRNPGEVEMRVIESIVHPRYDPDTVINDVAMLRLPWAARTDLGHGVACLPKANQPLMPQTTCVILGWGKKRPSDIHGTRILHEAQVSTVDQGVCRRAYWQYAITDNMVCAGRGRRDSCAGDSGGPLLCRDHNMQYYLQGITSFGDGCGKRGKYGIYTRTAGYVDWIREIMNKVYFD